MISKTIGIVLLSTAASLSSVAHAQTDASTLIDPTVPQGFDRGRNVSVLEQPRPDYDPLGIHVGSFLAFPTLQTAAGYSSNIFLVQDGAQDDGFIDVRPGLRVNSDWSQHMVMFRGDALMRRFLSNPIRNEDSWSADLLGRLDVGSKLSIFGEAQASRQYESPISGQINASSTVLSSYTTNMVRVNAEYTAGQSKALFNVDHSVYDFSNINFPDGSFVDQSNRDRTITRVLGQYEYAFTPSVSLYGQVTPQWTNYRQDLTVGVANRDSFALRTIGGINFDIAGLARGTVGLGYTWRNFDSPLYKDVDGFSIEARLDYFLSPLTTVSVAARRIIDDANIGATAAFFENRVSARVDHELLTNLLLNGRFEYSDQDYIGVQQTSNAYSGTLGAKYFSSRHLQWDLQSTYMRRTSDFQGTSSGTFNEFRISFGITFRS
jgi:hypothetical protein